MFLTQHKGAMANVRITQKRLLVYCVSAGNQRSGTRTMDTGQTIKALLDR